MFYAASGRSAHPARRFCLRLNKTAHCQRSPLLRVRPQRPLALLRGGVLAAGLPLATFPAWGFGLRQGCYGTVE